MFKHKPVLDVTIISCGWGLDSAIRGSAHFKLIELMLLLRFENRALSYDSININKDFTTHKFKRIEENI